MEDFYRVAAFLAAPVKAELPWGWRERAQRLVYGLLGDSGADVHGARYSLFTFSLLPREPVFGVRGLGSRAGRWVFRFASARRECAEAVYAKLLRMSALSLGGVSFSLEGLQKEPLADKAVFIAQPIVVLRRDKNGFVPAEDPSFRVAVVDALARRYEFWRGEPVPGGFDFSFTGRPRQKLIQYRGRNLVGFSGTVKLSGPKEVRLFAQAVGLGQKPSAGLGMVM